MRATLLWIAAGAVFVYWWYFQRALPGGPKDKTATKDKPGQSFFHNPFSDGAVPGFNPIGDILGTSNATSSAQDTVIRHQRNFAPVDTAIGTSDPGTPAGGVDYISQMIASKPYESGTLGLSCQSNADPNTPFASPLDYIKAGTEEPLSRIPSETSPGINGMTS